MSGLKETFELGKYLRVPITGRSPKVKYYQYLVQKVKNKLSNWRDNQLSFAGRATLANSAMEALPTYTMMSNKVPKTCLKEIQKTQSNFIWGDREGERHLHTIKWSEIDKPKND